MCVSAPSFWSLTQARIGHPIAVARSAKGIEAARIRALSSVTQGHARHALLWDRPGAAIVARRRPVQQNAVHPKGGLAAISADRCWLVAFTHVHSSAMLGHAHHAQSHHCRAATAVQSRSSGFAVRKNSPARKSATAGWLARRTPARSVAIRGNAGLAREILNPGVTTALAEGPTNAAARWLRRCWFVGLVAAKSVQTPCPSVASAVGRGASAARTSARRAAMMEHVALARRKLPRSVAAAGPSRK